MKKKKEELKPLTLPDPEKELKNRNVSTASKGKAKLAVGKKQNNEIPLLLEVYKLLVEINEKLDKMSGK
ncbi:MAG: hypothetical protein H8D88_01320 [Bacteroidetes bacterium]|nr:hypothetical protein [Bacteroidota bacterium]